MIWIQIAQLAAGAGAGAAFGALMSRMRTCSSGACRARPPLLLSMLAGALFGAAWTWYVIHR